MGANDDARLCNRLKESVLLDKHGWAHMVDKASGCIQAPAQLQRVW